MGKGCGGGGAPPGFSRDGPTWKKFQAFPDLWFPKSCSFPSLEMGAVLLFQGIPRGSPLDGAGSGGGSRSGNVPVGNLWKTLLDFGISQPLSPVPLEVGFLQAPAIQIIPSRNPETGKIRDVWPDPPPPNPFPNPDPAAPEG